MQHEFSPTTGQTFHGFAMCGASAYTTYQQLTSSAAGSLARTSAAPASAPESQAPDQDYGANSPDLFASYDPATCSWKTSQLCFMSFDAESVSLSKPLSGAFLESWPRSGTMQNGTAYRLPPLVRRISGIGSSYWPTPNATDGSKAPKFFGRGNPSLPQAVKMFPTPRALEAGSWQRDTSKGSGKKKLTLTGVAKRWPTPTVHGMEGRHTGYAQGGTSLSAAVQADTPGALNPQFVEWLMGFPIGWTD
jgi:hypothetical protein